MAWLYNGKILKVGRGWLDDQGRKHPYNWSSSWSAEEKTKWGVSWQDDEDTSYDNRFYWASGVERSLTDISLVDEDGNAIIDPTTGKQQVQKGLKSQWIEQTKATANEKLKVHDWQITRKYEKFVDIDSDVVTYRDAVRSACDTIETAINNCGNLDQFKALFEVPVDENNLPTGNAPIYNWPVEI